MAPSIPMLAKLVDAARSLSLARKGLLLVVLPAIAQSVLLVGLVIIQIETANFYPRRAEQDRSHREAETQMAVDGALTLRCISDFLNSKARLSPDCEQHFHEVQNSEAKLKEIWENFAIRRQGMVLFFLREPNEFALQAADGKNRIGLYQHTRERIALAVAAAREASINADAYHALLKPGLTPDQKRDDVSNLQFESTGKRAIDSYAAAREMYTHANNAFTKFLMVQGGEPIDPQSSTKERYLWMSLLIAYSFVNMGLLGGASLLFARNLLLRLQVLNDNGRRLALRQALHDRLPGSDEIALLDKSFHAMSAAIENSTRVHRLMMERATDLICSLDRTGRIESISNAAEAILGYPSEDILGSHLVDFIAEKHKERFVEKFKAVVSSKSQISFELPARTRSGAEVELLWSVTWSGVDNSVLCVTHDITDTKKAERLQQELVQMVSHDLRSPLVAISGFHEFAERGLFGALDERGIMQLRSAKRSTDQMLTLVNDLLEVERLDSGMLDVQKCDTDLRQVIATALANVGAQAQAKGIGISIQSSVDSVNADQHRLVQILINLLTNAIKISRPGSQILLQSRQLPDAVRISVTDFGEGLPEDDRKRIFDRFRQLRNPDDARPTGTGLGLAICKALVELHGGQIWVESQVGHGSTFIFTLPTAGGKG